jgi:hypothetical protein
MKLMNEMRTKNQEIKEHKKKLISNNKNYHKVILFNKC